jgi:dihydrofolate reductase
MKLIAAVDRHWALGRAGELLFSIPEDLHRFRDLTIGHTILYGRKTLLTFPACKPLPNRRNIVLTRNGTFSLSSATVCHTLMSALEFADDDTFVVGGASVYQQLLPYCTHAYITQIDADGNGDCFLENLADNSAWNCTCISDWNTYNGLHYRFLEYEKNFFKKI